MGAYKYIRQALINEYKGAKDENYNYRKILQEKMIAWRKEPLAVVPVDRPSNLLRARSLGYKAKDGVYLFRVKIRKGSGTHHRVNKGRKPKKMAVNTLTRGKSIQWIAEERVNKRFPGLEVLNSYLIGEDGQTKFFEVIVIDPFDPCVFRDKDLSWLAKSKHSGRVFRGKTSAGKKSRGLFKKGKGTEKTRPGIRAKGRIGK